MPITSSGREQAGCGGPGAIQLSVAARWWWAMAEVDWRGRAWAGRGRVPGRPGDRWSCDDARPYSLVQLPPATARQRMPRPASANAPGSTEGQPTRLESAAPAPVAAAVENASSHSTRTPAGP